MKFQMIPINKIKIGKNSRLEVRDGEIAGLMESISEEGLLQPIGVWPTEKGSFMISYGNRRFLAMSKLGWTSIPCVIVDAKNQKDVDIKNLAENVQRRNVSLIEIGRYIKHLIDEGGMTYKEIAIRLGVAKSYVEAASQAYEKVPAQFQNDIETRVGKGHTRPGKIALRTVQNLEAMTRKYRLNKEQKVTLYQIAKSEEFDTRRVDEYAKRIAATKSATARSIIDEVKETTHKVQLVLDIDKDDYEKALKRLVLDGPFKTFGDAIRAKLNGKVDFPTRVIQTR